VNLPETAAVSEAIGRLISYILRLSSPISPTERMREIVRQLLGIGGGRSLGFGPNRVRSLPDGIGQVLDRYLREKADELKTKAFTTQFGISSYFESRHIIAYVDDIFLSTIP
jgi:hypothetical protein